MKLSKIIGDPEKFINKEETKKIKTITEFKSNYDILNRLGVGATSQVDLVKEKSTGDIYAAKTFNRSGVEPPKQLWGFLQILTQIDHPNLVRIYDSFADYQQLILIIEYSKGGNLLNRISSKTSFTESDVANIVQMILSGIIYLHEHKIAHSDLKPENILFIDESSDTIKLSDYGLYNIMKPETLLSSSIGTPDFCPPEILTNKTPGIESDIWNTGVITYFLLTGQLPFKGSLYQRYQSITSGQVEFGPEFEKFSSDAKDFVTKCLVFNANERLKDTNALEHPWFLKPGSNPIQRDAVIDFLQKRKQTRENPEMKDSIALKILRSDSQNGNEFNEDGNLQQNNVSIGDYTIEYDCYDFEDEFWPCGYFNFLYNLNSCDFCPNCYNEYYDNYE